MLCAPPTAPLVTHGARHSPHQDLRCPSSSQHRPHLLQCAQRGDEQGVIRPKRIYFPEHFCYCFSSNLCVLNTTNTD
jgi:hypothetical protein